LCCFSQAAFSDQGKAENAKIVEMTLRTLEYTADNYADMALVQLDKNFTSNADGCSPNVAYFLANHDKALYSALLAAKLSDKPLDFFIDASLPKKGGWCKLVAVAIK
jgi:hypothetical protein